MRHLFFTVFFRLIYTTVALFCLSGYALAYCSGTTVTSPFLPAVVSISKNTPVGQVVSSATVTLTVTCTSAGVDSSNQWTMNYTPKAPLVATSLGQGTFATGMSGLGYRMYTPSGALITPTSYGTNGGDNFGPNGCLGGLCHTPADSTNTYIFSLELVRTDLNLTSGTFSNSLMSFGYQYGNGGCPGACTLAFGSEVTSPVQFNFIPPMCTVANSSLTVTLPTIKTSDLNTIGATAGGTPFSIGLADCVLQTGVVMSMNGTTDGVSSVLKNTGTASGVGVQLLNGGVNGSPLILNSAMDMGNVGLNTTMTIPLAANYYQIGQLVGSGTVLATSTVTFTYN
ncbi:fimbrial protein [Raoultella terrigena]|uniref:fimbrial protein n=1 Tax=Raoultella terrigena TaxID=577 RepID=UPI0025B1E8F0|nr:fimbrial protein [Raoultella terrigena]WJV38360.1 fimbrial protein [Raoultella terrigena]